MRKHLAKFLGTLWLFEDMNAFFVLDLLGCAIWPILLPINIEDNVELGFGGTFAQHHFCLVFQYEPNFSNSYDNTIIKHTLFVEIVLYMNSEELCTFTIVWFRFTSCHLGLHCTKRVNRFLIMLGWIINFAWRVNSGDSCEDHKHGLKKRILSCQTFTL